MSAADRIRAILATLDADIAALTRLRALVAAALDAEPEPDEPGNSSGPVPMLRLVSDPKPPVPVPVPVPEPRSKYMRPILSLLASGPLTVRQIRERIGKAESYWIVAFKGCGWFERENPAGLRPWLWRLSEAGRAALPAATDSAPSADTATGATSTDPAACAGRATTHPA